jgi:hypothetical protein
VSASGLVVSGVAALKENADRLGLTWDFKFATIAGESPLVGTFDGDTTTVGMISVIGLLTAGARVAVLVIPPGLNVAFGTLVSNDRTLLTNRATFYASGNQTLTTSDADWITGSVTTLGAADYEVIVNSRFQVTGAGAAVATGNLVVDGTTDTSSQILWGMNAVTDQNIVTTTWNGTLSAGGVHTFAYQIRKSAALGTSNAAALGSVMTVRTYE